MRATATKRDEPYKLILPGTLQLAVLGALWREDAHRPMSFRRVVRAVCMTHKEVADSTVSTTLTRLIERGWVLRTGKYGYKPGISREELVDTLTQAIMEA